MLKRGTTGIEVRQLQNLLNDNGFSVLTDGWFGENTEAAVIAAQRRFGLVVDGVAGSKTLAALAAHDRPARLLTEAALQRGADRLGVPLAVIKAVNEVESRGQGFLADGRPVILYERHIMHRQLKAAGLDADALADRHPALVNPRRGGYLGGAAEHGRINQASLIDRACALASASWGLFQIMGFHWRALGYDSAEHFARLMARSEPDQFDAFMRFIEANPALHKALQARKWDRFAAGYNGPDYRANAYDLKLARAFERYAVLELPA